MTIRGRQFGELQEYLQSRRQRGGRHRREQRRRAAEADAALPRQPGGLRLLHRADRAGPQAAAGHHRHAGRVWHASAFRRIGCGSSSTWSTTTAPRAQPSTSCCRSCEQQAHRIGEHRLPSWRSTRSTRASVARALTWPRLARDSTDYKAADRQGRRPAGEAGAGARSWRPGGWPAASCPSSTRASRRLNLAALRLGRGRRAESAS